MVANMLDWERVKELHDEIGDAEFDEVVELFLDEVEEVLMRLHGHPEPSRLEEDMHFLKGCAWNLGFRRLGALCADAEQAATEGRAADIDIAAVLGAYSDSKQPFIEGISRLREPGKAATA